MDAERKLEFIELCSQYDTRRLRRNDRISVINDDYARSVKEAADKQHQRIADALDAFNSEHWRVVHQMEAIAGATDDTELKAQILKHANDLKSRFNVLSLSS